MSAYIQFGIGSVIIDPNAGNQVANPTPRRVIGVQDASLEMTGDVKELRGNYRYPDDTVAGDMKCSGKFGINRKDLTLFNSIVFADTVVTGGNSVQVAEAHTVTAGAATVAPPGSGTFVADLGVNFQSSGLALVRVASTPAVGQYSVSAGVYTFNTGDNTKVVQINYSYSLSSTGSTYQINNQLLGYGPQCALYFVDQYVPVGGVFNVIKVYAARFTKISLGNKRDDYSKPELDFSFFADPSGRVIDMYTPAV